MIGFLSGTIIRITPQFLILNVSGVGYKVLVPSSVLTKAVLSQPLELHVYTHVREDSLELFGFSDPQDLTLFEYLISVNGVGCKTALGIFSVGSRSSIIQAISTADTGFFMGVPRLGKKNAQKIIIELKNKIGATTELDLQEESGREVEEAVLALQGFGYTQREAQAAIQAIKGQGVTTEEKIKLALKYLGK